MFRQPQGHCFASIPHSLPKTCFPRATLCCPCQPPGTEPIAHSTSITKPHCQTPAPGRQAHSSHGCAQCHMWDKRSGAQVAWTQLWDRVLGAGAWQRAGSSPSLPRDHCRAGCQEEDAAQPWGGSHTSCLLCLSIRVNGLTLATTKTFTFPSPASPLAKPQTLVGPRQLPQAGQQQVLGELPWDQAGTPQSSPESCSGGSVAPAVLPRAHWSRAHTGDGSPDVLGDWDGSPDAPEDMGCTDPRL